ncbi:response regulator [Novosphingobium huizhouense]|uniref:response regulator n=1 Tax=Novosphingobium huizhouense TaxID=2866625 RepID=UPI001CD8CE54|nr:response regulator [Novosphingobium huizhouense]
MTITATDRDPADTPAPASEDTPKARVLIVDDTLTVRLYCSQLLKRAGFAVSEAINGLEGLEQALNQRFDLFVVDINMQKMDGYAFLAEVRRHGDLRSVPAVMMSTEQGREDIARAFQSGANFYLTKPIDPTRFLATVNLMTGVPCR